MLEANRIGWGCSGRNGGFCSIGLGKEDFGDWVGRFGLAGAKQVFGQGLEAVRTVKGIIETEQIEVDRSPEGGSSGSSAESPCEMAARQRELKELFGIDSRLLGKAELEQGYLVSREAHGACSTTRASRSMP